MPLKKALLISAAMPLFTLSLAGLAEAHGAAASAPAANSGPVLVAQADSGENPDVIKKRRHEQEQQGSPATKGHEERGKPAKPQGGSAAHGEQAAPAKQQAEPEPRKKPSHQGASETPRHEKAAGENEKRKSTAPNEAASPAEKAPQESKSRHQKPQN
ncbi:MAG TPA: hypothetical protein VFJ18_04765, partial [Pararhizobium sp.]|nr:hypothetical protein [Pararhizobium sp.]